MLKWTVSKRTDAADIDTTTTTSTTTTTTNDTFFAEPARRGAHPRDRRRVAASSQIIATPQPLTMRQLIATSTPYGSQEALALRDVRQTASPSPIRRRQPANRAYACTLPTFDVEYSPMPQRCGGAAIALRGLTIPDSFFGNARYFPAASDEAVEDGPPAMKRRKVSGDNVADNNNTTVDAEAQRSQRMAAYVDEEAALNTSSQALDDAELSRMIDDILQSKRKPTTARGKRVAKHPLSPLLDEDFAFISHKPILPPAAAKTAAERSPSEQSKQIADLMTDHPYLRESIDLLAGMSTPKDVRASDADAQPLRQRSAAGASHDARSPVPNANGDGAQASGSATGTPLGPEQIRRCLQFPESPESMESWLEKRKSIASTVSTTSSRCSTKSAAASGTLNLAVRATGTEIEVHVIRCKDLVRAGGGAINAYVKVARLAAGQTAPDAGFQRTRVHRDSAEPFFNHRFIFDGPPSKEGDGEGGDEGDRIQLTVWHRDRQSKRSEFLGCLAFPVHTIRERSVFGAFALQAQSSLTAAVVHHPHAASLAALVAASPLTEQTLRKRDATASMAKRQRTDMAEILTYLDQQSVHKTPTECGRNVDSAYTAHSLCVGLI